MLQAREMTKLLTRGNTKLRGVRKS